MVSVAKHHQCATKKPLSATSAVRCAVRTKRTRDPGAPTISKAERVARRKKLVRLVERLPEATATLQAGHRHMSLEVRGKRFGWMLDDHQGDGRLALNCRGPAGANKMLVTAEPELFHLPRYLWHRGWIGAWLDIGKVDWSAVDAVLTDAYRMTAPRALVARMNAV